MVSHVALCYGGALQSCHEEFGLQLFHKNWSLGDARTLIAMVLIGALHYSILQRSHPFHIRSHPRPLTPGNECPAV